VRYRIVFVVGAIAVALVQADMASADMANAKRKPHPRAIERTVSVPATPGVNSMAPPRMIEVQPGTWISSYGCVMEDSQGRLTDCSVNDSR
jgi:hypothetical protein